MSEETEATAPGERPTWWRPALAGLGVIAVAATVYAVADRGGDPAVGADPGAVANPNESLTVHDGDAVRGAGVVVRMADQPATLCEPLPVADVAYPPGQEPPLECSKIAVPLAGLDENVLPDWTERDGVWFTGSFVTIDGVWADDELVVSTVGPADLPGELDPDYWRVPCDPPPGGWLDGDGLDITVPEDWENARRDLALEMEAHPDRYHSTWVGYPDGDALAPDAAKSDMGEPMPEHIVMMVSTVDEPTAVQSQLAAVYPGNLCVVQVDYSAADLAAVVDRLEGADDSWWVQSHPSKTNRVEIELPVLDDDAVRLIGADAPMVEVLPMLRPS